MRRPRRIVAGRAGDLERAPPRRIVAGRTGGVEGPAAPPKTIYLVVTAAEPQHDQMEIHMTSEFHLRGGQIAAYVAAIALDIAMPLALALIARRRLGVSWRYFGYGALIFLLFQLISRVPIVTGAQALIAPQLQSSLGLRIGWAVLLAATAGIFEEVGRYVGYRWLMRREEKTWAKAVMYGLGHGGLESIVLVGGLTIATLIGLLSISAVGLDKLPPEQRDVATKQLAALSAQPDWLPLLGAWERMWTLAIHVALSVVVLQVFRRGRMIWLWLAILAHALIDLVAVGVPLMGFDQTATIFGIEGFVALVGLLGLWVVRALREPPPATPEPPPEAADAARDELADIP